MTNLFSTILELTFKASIIFIVVYILQKLFQNFLSPKIKYLMWFLIIVSLTFPITIESRVSIYSLPSFFEPQASVQINEISKTNTNKNVNISTEYISNKPIVNSKSNDINTNTLKDNEKNKTLPKKNFLTANYLLKFASLIWLLGLFSFMIIYILQLKKIKSIVNCQEELNDEAIVSILEEAKSTLNISKNIKLYKTNEFSTPAITGILKVKILIPEYLLTCLSKNDLKFIIHHELCHLKRLDNITNYLILIYKTIYWFNPLIYIMFKHMRRDMEISCDNLVLDNINEKEHLDYGRTIINIMEKMSFQKQSVITTCLIEDKDEIARRIMMIKRYKNFSKLISVFTLAITIFVGCSAVSEPPKNNTKATQEVTKIEDEPKSEIKIDEQYLITLEKAESILKDKDNFYSLSKVEEALNLERPYVYTFYLDESDLESEEPSEIMLYEMIYPIKSDKIDSALKVYSQYHEVADIKIDKFNGVPSNDYKDTTYKVNHYTAENLVFLEKDFTFNQDFIISFLGQDIAKLNKKFNISFANVEAFLQDTGLKISFYLVGEESYGSDGATKGLYVLTKDSKIVGLKMINDSLFMFDKLDSMFDSTTYKNTQADIQSNNLDLTTEEAFEIASKTVKDYFNFNADKSVFDPKYIADLGHYWIVNVRNNEGIYEVSILLEDKQPFLIKGSASPDNKLIEEFKNVKNVEDVDIREYYEYCYSKKPISKEESKNIAEAFIKSTPLKDQDLKFLESESFYELKYDSPEKEYYVFAYLKGDTDPKNPQNIVFIKINTYTREIHSVSI